VNVISTHLSSGRKFLHKLLRLIPRAGSQF
jgi:hypothetical protein